MKKLVLIFTIAFLSLGLAGCDLISPQQVEEISEEYCRENPTSEICQGDAVGDLEDDIILNVFNTIINEYNDETNDTFCDDYFSVTNPDLLDACRASREALVPEDLTGFSVVSVERQNTLSTQDVYEITIITDDLTVEVVFSIGLVNVEGIMYISSWSFDLTNTSPTDYDVSLEDAQAFFEQFLVDYMNPEISSSEVCNQYFTDEDADGCVEARDDSLDVNINIVLNEMDVSSETGVFDVELAIDDDDDVEIEFMQVSFVYDETGNIVMTFIHDEEPGDSDNWLNADLAFEVINEYLADYTNVMISNDEFNDQYFDGEMDWDFFLSRNDEIDKGVVYTLIFVDDPTEEPFDYLDVTLQRTYEGESKTIVVKLRVNDLGDGTYLFDILFDSFDSLDLDMLWDYMQDFVDDYQDLSISDSDICMMYFPNDDIDDCIGHRQETLATEAFISIIDFYPVNDYYEIIFEFDNGTDITTTSVFVSFYYDEDNILRFEFNDLGFDEIDYDDALAFMQDFLMQYSDSTLPSTEVCAQFFEGPSYDECVMRREAEMADGIILNDFTLFNDGYGYQIDFYYLEPLGDTVTKHLDAYFYFDEFGDLKLELFENFELLPYDVVYPYLEAMAIDFNNPSIVSEAFCDLYFSPENISSCVEHREQVLFEGFTITISMLTPEYDHYRVEFEYNSPVADSWYETINAFFYYDDDGVLKVDFRGDGPEEFPYDEALLYFQTFLLDFNDPILLDSEFCGQYFPGAGDLCLWDRALLPLDDLNIYLSSFTFDGYSFVADVTFENLSTGGIEYRTVYLDFYWDEYGNIGIHLSENPMGAFLNYGDAVIVIEQFFLDIADPTISDDELFTLYFDYLMGSELPFDRLDIISNGYTLLISQINDPMEADGQEFLEVIFDTFDDTGIIGTTTVWMRVMSLPSGNYILELQSNTPTKVDLSFDDAYDFVSNFMTDYSDETIDSYTVCSTYFDSFDYPRCIERRDQEMMDGVTVQFIGLDEPNPGEFYIEVDYFDADGLFMYTDYVEVIFFTAELGELKLFIRSFEPNFSFPQDEAMNYVNMFLTDFMDPTIPTVDFCDNYDMFLPDCETIRTGILNNDGYVYYSNLYPEVDNIFYFEFAYQLTSDEVAVYTGIYLEFMFDEYGEIIVTPHNNPNSNFIYVDFIAAQDYWLLYLNDYVNPSISTDQLVNTYFGGFVDDAFYDERADDLLRGVTFNLDDVTFDDPYIGNGIDWLTVTYILSDGTDDDILTEYFRVMLFDDGYFQMELQRFYPEVVEYSVALDLFDVYLIDLFDPTIDNDQFCATYSEEWSYSECTAIRNDLTTNFAYGQILDFYFDDYMFAYRAVVDFYGDDDGFIETREFDVMYWYNIDGLLKLDLMEGFNDFDPIYNDLFDLIMEFPVAYTDLTVDSIDFCNLYFPAEPDCAILRDEVLASPTFFVSVDNFYSYDMFDVMGYQAEITYDLGEGSFIRQTVEVVPYFDEADILQMGLYITNTETSVPVGATLLNESDALYYLNAFASDFSNSAVSYEDFCLLYFNGNSHCFDDRFEFIEMGGSLTFVDLTVTVDVDGISYLSVEFQVNFDGEIESAFVNLNVWLIDDDNVFIEWVKIDDAPPID